MPANDRPSQPFAELLAYSILDTSTWESAPVVSNLDFAQIEQRVMAAMTPAEMLIDPEAREPVLTADMMRRMRLMMGYGASRQQVARIAIAGMEPAEVIVDELSTPEPVRPAPITIEERPVNQQKSILTELQAEVATLLQVLQATAEAAEELRVLFNDVSPCISWSTVGFDQDYDQAQWVYLTIEDYTGRWPREMAKRVPRIDTRFNTTYFNADEVRIYTNRMVARHPAIVMACQDLQRAVGRTGNQTSFDRLARAVIMDYVDWQRATFRFGCSNIDSSADYRSLPHLNRGLSNLAMMEPYATTNGNRVVFDIDTPLWQVRERVRLINTYEALPQAVIDALPATIIETQVPHLATKPGNTGLVAFTQSPVAGELDRQQVIKPGRYLRQHCPDLSDEQIKQLVAECQAKLNVQFNISNKLEDFVRVYSEGPSSCMGYSIEGGAPKNWSFTRTGGKLVHPVSVYAYPGNNIAIAWLEANGRIGARAILNTQRQRWVRMYGSDSVKNASERLGDWLREQGYRNDTSCLIGEKIAKIHTDRGGYVCPYIDGDDQSVSIQEDHLLIGEGRDRRCADHSTGCLDSGNSWECTCCGDGYDEDESYTLDYWDNRVCDSCLESEYVEVANGRSGDTFWHNVSNYTNMTIYSTRHARESFASCDYVYFSSGVPGSYVELSEAYYDCDDYFEATYIADLEDCIADEDGDYLLTEDVGDHDLFVHPDGVACKIDNYCIVDGEVMENDEVDFDTVEQCSNRTSYLMLDAYISIADDEEAEQEDAA